MRDSATPVLVACALVALVVGGCCCRPCCGVSTSGAVRVGPSVPDEPQVLVEMTTVRIRVDAAESVLGDWRPSADGLVREISEAEAERLLTASREDERAEILHQPALLAVNEQTATVSVGEFRAEDRKAAAPRRAGESGFDYDLRTSTELMSIELTPTMRDDRTIRIAFRSALKERAPEGANPADVLVTRIETTFDSPDPGHVLVGTPDPVERDGEHFFHVTLVHVVGMQPSEAASFVVGDRPAN